ncbi:hypothetical protein ANN_12032, partial [Periplaneta americana]
LTEFGWELFDHPPYSPDLAPSDFQFSCTSRNSCPLLAGCMTYRSAVTEMLPTCYYCKKPVSDMFDNVAALHTSLSVKCHAKQLIEDTIRRNASPVRLEQPDKERMGGSSSSLNSSASDESNRFPGVRRSALLHSFSTNDASLGEYKYTVTVGNQSIKITGTNLDLVRTAKLVLDEHFNHDSEQYYGAGDFYATYEDEPKTPCTPLPSTPPGKFSAASRVDSQDSNATSESDETYKAPVILETASVPTPCPDNTLGNQLTVVRQPLFPDASKEAFQQAEASVRSTDLSARNRRACFAHTNSQQQKEELATTKTETQSSGR